ncbi:MAG: serine hydrolase [Rhodobacteraceae bacterium]|nr:serine hydrolase [Paracoccaceae bacterium]
MHPGPQITGDSDLDPASIPPGDWDRAPWNRWSFQNVRKILPTVDVSRGTGPVIPLPQNLHAIGDIEFTGFGGSHMSVGEMLDSSFTDGFLIAIDGKIIHESYHNGMTPETQHLAQSVSKSIVSTVAGILIGRGLLDPMRPVTDFLPELTETAWNGALLQHVLDMTSGAKFDENYTALESDIAKTDVACGWKPIPAGADPATIWPKSMWEQIQSLKTQEVEHGSRFEYRSIETDVLAFVMEKVSGKGLAQLVSDELWSKIGAENDAFFTVDSTGYALADGGFNATLRDFARFGLLHLNDGKIGETQIVPKAWIDDIRSGAHGLFNEVSREFMPNGCYRNKFWIEDAAKQTIVALGVFGQMIYISPEDNLVAVKLSTFPDFLNTEFEVNTLRAICAVAMSRK